jgi:hypothetical protein
MPPIPPDGDPYHTSTDEESYHQRNVHHNRSICPEGKKIKEKNIEYGGTNKALCDWCKANPR